jgi:hypothetical protein
MVKLLSYGEIHPLVGVQRILLNGSFIGDKGRELYLEVARHLRDFPEEGRDGDFWRSVQTTLLSAYEGLVDEDLFVQNCGDKPFGDLLREEIGVTHRGLCSEFKLVDNIGPQLLFVEGVEGSSIVGSYASGRGVRVVYLDENNKYYSFLAAGLAFDFGGYDWNQDEREKLWVEKIRPEPRLNKAFLVAGSGHVDENKFGLVEKLDQVGIVLDPQEMDLLF